MSLLLNPPAELKLPKTRLNTADRIGDYRYTYPSVDEQITYTYLYSGNTPLHLAMESGHGDVAVLLIEAGADRTRVRLMSLFVLL